MRIGLDYRPALKPNSRRRGIGRYVRELTDALLRRGDPKDFLLYVFDTRDDEPLPKGVAVRRSPYLRKPSRLNWVLEAAWFPCELYRNEVTLLHSFEPVSAPHWPMGRVLPTVHDLIPYLFPEEVRRHVPWDFRLAQRWAWRGMRRAVHLVAISQCTKDDLVSVAGIPPDRITVVYPGCNFSPPTAGREELRDWASERLGLAEGFLLYVGGTDFRKNVGFLLEGFARLRRDGYRGALVLVGETFMLDIPETRELRRRAEGLGIAGAIRRLGWVDEETLARLYASADAFVFPSRYEGFGLPVVEAMRCGATILAARTSSIPEVAGEAAYYFDPADLDGFVAAFAHVRGAPAEAEHRRLVGLRRAAGFTWDRAADRILEIYRTLGNV
jgi:glycosyltransferase involved in cell wall biosynthesis